MIEDLKPYPETKDSGLAWLGEIPAHWDIKRNGSLFQQRNAVGEPDWPILEVSLRTGVRIREFGSSKRKQVMSDKAKYKCAAKGDYVYNMMRMWQGAAGIAPVDGLVSPAYVVAKPLPHVNPGYFASLFRIDDYLAEIDAFSRGIVKDRNRLYWDQFKQIPTPCPPPEEQDAIVRFLTWATNSLDRAIRAKRRIIDLLNEQKQAIIHRAVIRGLDPFVPLKDSGIPWLGVIPVHWEVRKLKKVTPKVGVGLVINPSSHYVDHHVSGAVPMLLGNNIVPMGLRLERLRYISRMANEELPASRLSAGDIVVVRVGAPGVAAVVPPHLDGCNCASVMIVRGHISYAADWLALCFNSSVASRQIDIVKYGAAQKQFNIGHAVDFLFPVPPLKEQLQIVDCVATEALPISKTASRVESEITLLREYRTRLIADVVTGKLDVRQAAAGLPEEIKPLDPGEPGNEIEELDPDEEEAPELP